MTETKPIEEALETLANKYERTDGGTNVFFVRKNGRCILASLSFRAAYNYWESLDLRDVPELGDREHGVI